MDFLEHLNPAQREAVAHVHGPLLILAGAGSGKTRVIVHRVAHLLASGHARPDELLAVTFTNKAAAEMRSRVEGLLGTDCRDLWVSTFHALCARLLRREGPAIGLSRDFVIYDSSDQVMAMRQVLRDLHIDDSLVQPRAALSQVSRAKNSMEGAAAIRASAWGTRGEQLAQAYERYTSVLRDSNALDFDDLLLKTVQLFDEAASVAARYAERFRFIMVDEYQDTNKPQYLLVRHLAARHGNLCVVGDPDQSIYRWRGADVRNILDFERDFPDPLVVQLEQNYRSTQTILDAASAVINLNRQRRPKRLWTDTSGGAQIVCYRGADELEEAAFITRTARTVLAEEPGQADGDGRAPTLAVLYRTNAQSRVIEDALTREGLAFRIIGGVRFYERKEIKDTLAYLKLILNPHDDVAMRRVINVPSRGIGRGVLDGLDRLPAEAPLDQSPLLAADPETRPPASLWARLERVVTGRLLPTRATSALRGFQELMVGLRETSRDESVSIVIGKLLDQTGYLRDLREQGSLEAEGRVENLLELVSAAREFELREAEPSLSGFVDRLSLLSEADEDSGAQDARVWLMTLHSAKGLEFPAVVISGLEEGLFPHARATADQAELDEERRLCYVGMTRARSRLLFTSAARRRTFGEYRPSEPSRFLDELPDALVDRIESPTLGAYQRAFSTAGLVATPYPRRRSRHAEPQPGHQTYSPQIYRDEDEDQSLAAVRLGSQVRHPRFGVGTVVGIEPVADDVKMVVRFSDGAKTLRARYAKLEPV